MRSSRRVRMRDLESLGVQVWTGAAVTEVTAEGVSVGSEKLAAATVLWGAGVQGCRYRHARSACRSIALVESPSDRISTIPDHPEVFVVGDMAHALGADGKPLPGVALVAMQQGMYFATVVRRELRSATSPTPRKPFRYVDLGSMATIGRSRAIAEFGPLRLSGWFAWWFWLIVHIYRLERLSQSPVGAHSMGVVVFDLQSRRAIDRRQGVEAYAAATRE